MKIQPVIMSGGAGTRLWPMSRKARPKQFLPLASEKTMFQETVLRAAPGDMDGAFLDPVVIAGKGHASLIADQLREIEIAASAVILEPVPRNTAAVAAVAAAWVRKNRGDALILLMPADHHIEDGKGFREAVARGAEAANDGHIVTFGIEPKIPHTGFGYIQSGDNIRQSVFKVAEFKEKPDRATAEKYLAAGCYHWNAGIFLFGAGAMLDELARHEPGIKASAEKALDAATPTDAALMLDEAEFSACPSNSIDYAVMERTDLAAVVAPVDVGWSDIGSWSELKPNTADARVFEHNTNGNIISTTGPFVAAAGVEDLIIVATEDAVLVARRDHSQDVRTVVEELKKRNREDLL